MTHAELVAAAVTGHGAVFSAGLVATVLSWPFKPGIERGNEILEKIRRRMVRQLGVQLKSVFESGAHVEQIGVIFGPDGAAWQREPVRFLESEEFSNALFYFVEENAEAMADYRLFRVIIDRCRFWSQYFGFGLFMLMLFEVGLIAIIWGGEKVCGMSIPAWVIKGTLLVPILTVTNCFLGFGRWLYNRSRGGKYKVTYE